jgi:hypothetical protein
MQPRHFCLAPHAGSKPVPSIDPRKSAVAHILTSEFTSKSSQGMQILDNFEFLKAEIKVLN